MRASLVVAALTLLPAALFADGREKASTPPPWYDRVTFKAWVQLDAVFPEDCYAHGGTSNFRVRRARPTFIVQTDPDTKVQFQMDLSTGRSGGGASSATITDTFAERRLPGVGYVSFGQQLLPFGHEIHEDNAALRSPLELSFAAEQMALGERDIGIQLRTDAGEEALWHWELGFVNGQGFRTADANSNKSFVGRLTHRFHRYFRAGVSSIAGTFRAGGKDFDRNVLGVEFRSHFSRALQLEGEVYDVKFVDNPANPTKAARYRGGYLMLETWIGPLKSIPFVRVQRTHGDLEYSSVDVGWRWQFTNTQRLTAQYDFVKGARRDCFATRWQLSF